MAVTSRPPPAGDDARDAARSAGLHHSSDAAPGIRRHRRGKGFVYVAPDGRRVTRSDVLARIRALAIPPAWTDVWVCPSGRGHLQATGRDARGRKQYRYHERWRAIRDETKFDRLIGFGSSLPVIRRAVERDLAKPGLPRERVIAAVVSLLDKTFLRIGNDEYAKANGSFGLTTLRARHVDVRGSTITFAFVGKAGKRVDVDIDDPRCARVVRRCRDLPGYRLFRYVADDGEIREIDSGDVNAYLDELTATGVTAKDFRTWAGTVLFARAAKELGSPQSARVAKAKVNMAVAAVAAMLGNTAAVCRACYIHPGLIDAYTDGAFEDLWNASARARIGRLRRDEATVLAMLKKLRRTQKAGSVSARAA